MLKSHDDYALSPLVADGLMNPPAITVSSATQTRAAPSGVVLVFALLFAAALAPILWFSIPAAMVDYPNHLARMFVLSRDGGVNANPYYQVTWSFTGDQVGKVSYKGTLDGTSKMKGTVEYGALGDGTFTAEKK